MYTEMLFTYLLYILTHYHAGYKVIVTLADGSEMSYTLEPQLSVVLPKPSGEYTVSVTAINHVGSSEPQVAQTMIIGMEYSIAATY